MHVAIIMDGNGRWAAARGLPRTAGHAEGAKAVRRIVEAAVRNRIRTLTLYAFSCDNWGRPAHEVATLMRLFRRYLMSETQRCLDQGVRLSVIGRRDRLDAGLLATIVRSEALTAAGETLQLRIAIDYSAKYSIVQAALLPGAASASFEAYLHAIEQVTHSRVPAGAVDLLIRTGGEQRLSDFMLWESAYAELFFTACPWPQFDAAGFEAALQDYHGRQRRFGKLALPSAAEEDPA